MITPTIGRIVWFHSDLNCSEVAAIVTAVVNDRCVDLTVFWRGEAEGKFGVQLLQDGEKPPIRGPYCEWMPYQKAVAKGEIAPTLHAESKP